jgi:hypothetical protein
LTQYPGKDCAHLEITFLKDNVQYRYGFEARTQQNEQEIVSEWLYQATSSAETTLFERTGDQVKRGRRFAEGAALLNQGRLRRKNSLYLSLTAQLGGETASALVEHITKKVRVITGLNDKHLHTYTVDCLKQGRYRDGILRLIREADTGIPEINVPEEKDIEDIISIVEESFGSEVPHEEWEQIHAMAKRGLSVMAVHPVFGTDGQKVKTISFPMQWFESQGTQKLFAFAGPILNTLDCGDVLFVDEMDARFHPLLTRALIRLFQSSETNPKNAQLIFITHDTNLLDPRRFRRDQIWFVEKDRFGASHLYSLADFKGVRKDASFEDDYFQGRYGAIPFWAG